jgi:hypothetical protein
MRGAMPSLPQYALIAWCSVEAQGQLYLYESSKANCVNKTYSRTCMGLSDAFSIQNGLKQGDALLPLLFNFAF